MRRLRCCRGRGCGALPLHRRMGRDYHRQKSGRDSRRLERSALRARRPERRPGQSQGSDSRQRQSQIRLGEEGRADQLLHGRGQGPNSRQLRSAPRDRGALLRSQGVYAHQPAGRHGRRAAAWCGSRTWTASTRGRTCRCGRASRLSTRIFACITLPGFEIARKATDRADLQLRMQGNAFLGAFFAVSPMLQEFGITQEQYREVVYKQYVKKFGKLGDAVVQSNMEVMLQGFDRREGDQDRRAVGCRSLDAARPGADADSGTGDCGRIVRDGMPFYTSAGRTGAARADRQHCDCSMRSSARTMDTISRQRRLSAMGVIAAATGDTASKYVARRETPLYIPENCTQCMECISVCPDTALPNCSQDLGTLLRRRFRTTWRMAWSGPRCCARCRRLRSRHARAW
jgi:NAD-dependent dihydropyrimidine dehydrogenase PreA subunit